ncbi:hypothetical protein HDU98_000726 [Podochytrium sp. JEL0797]|nr:hypothetical protein HDU98_000726 [Podochytrium sp. JEL0797]
MHATVKPLGSVDKTRPSQQGRHEDRSTDTETIAEIELLFPDGSIATVSKQIRSNRSWQPDRTSSITAKSAPNRHLAFHTTLKAKTARPKCDPSLESKKSSHFLITPRMTLSDRVAATPEFPEIARTPMKNAISRPTPASKSREREPGTGGPLTANFLPVQIAIMQVNQTPKPKAISPSTPPSLFTVNSSSSYQLHRQMWCHEYGFQQRNQNLSAASLFTSIQLPKIGRRKSPPPPIPLFTSDNRVQRVKETKARNVATTQMVDWRTEIASAAGSDDSRTVMPRFPKVKIGNRSMRPQPPFPTTIGPSTDQIMKDMNKALNNLYFFPRSDFEYQAPCPAKSKTDQNQTKHQYQRRSKSDRFEHKQDVTATSFIDRARQDYGCFHFKREDFAMPFSLPSIEVSHGTHPEEPTNHHIVPYLASEWEDVGESDTKIRIKAKPVLEPTIHVPPDVDEDSKLVLFGFSVSN